MRHEAVKLLWAGSLADQVTPSPDLFTYRTASSVYHYSPLRDLPNDLAKAQRKRCGKLTPIAEPVNKLIGRYIRQAEARLRDGELLTVSLFDSRKPQARWVNNEFRILAARWPGLKLRHVDPSDWGF